MPSTDIRKKKPYRTASIKSNRNTALMLALTSFFIRAAPCRGRFRSLNDSDCVNHVPHMIGHASGHRRRNAQRLVNATKVAITFQLRHSPAGAWLSRRFPPPWSVEERDACFIVREGNRQALA